MIAAYAFVQYFYFLFFIGLGPESGGTVVHPGNLVLGTCKVSQVSAGGCHANNI